MTSPAFRHQPTRGSWSMIAYGGRAMGEDLEPLEVNYQRPTADASIRSRAKFEAAYHFRTHVKVRNLAGTVIFDGPIATENDNAQ